MMTFLCVVIIKSLLPNAHIIITFRSQKRRLKQKKTELKTKHKTTTRAMIIVCIEQSGDGDNKLYVYCLRRFSVNVKTHYQNDRFRNS